MDLIDVLKNLSQKIIRLKEVTQTEEATKNAFVMPFIASLGYDLFDPTEVVPEYTADIGIKKGEKIDYAIIKDDLPIIFFECKKIGADLEFNHASQLYRYFAANTKARIGVLTNGANYHFYADLDESNIMDSKPFLEINMLDLQEPAVNELKKLSKSLFNLDDILSTASELKYLKETKRIFAEQLVSPSEEFVKFFAGQIYTGVKTQKVINTFTDVVKRGFSQFINEKINDRLKIAMAPDSSQELKTEMVPEVEEPKNSIETTQDEIESLYIIKSILRDVLDVNRLSIKDFKTVCTIILDNKALKTVAKLYFTANKKVIGIPDLNKVEVKYAIDDLNDLYKYSDQLRTALNLLLANNSDNNDVNE